MPEDITAALAGKVDKITGKGLSANDYTDEDKAKLASVSQFFIWHGEPVRGKQRRHLHKV